MRYRLIVRPSLLPENCRNILSEAGRGMQKWALERFPTVVTWGTILLGGYFLYGSLQEFHYTQQLFNTLPDLANNVLNSAVAFDLHQIDSSALVPHANLSVAFPLPNIHIDTPNLEKALTPVIEGRNNLLEAAKKTFTVRVSETVKAGEDTFLYGIIGLVGVPSPLTHPLERLIKGPVDQAGRLLDTLGKVF